MRAQVISVVYDELNDPLMPGIVKKNENALRVRLAGGKVLFVRLGLFGHLQPEIVFSTTPRWGRNLKLKVLNEAEVDQQIIGHLISMVKHHDEAAKSCFRLLNQREG